MVNKLSLKIRLVIFITLIIFITNAIGSWNTITKLNSILKENLIAKYMVLAKNLSYVSKDGVKRNNIFKSLDPLVMALQEEEEIAELFIENSDGMVLVKKHKEHQHWNCSLLAESRQVAEPIKEASQRSYKNYYELVVPIYGESDDIDFADSTVSKNIIGYVVMCVSFENINAEISQRIIQELINSFFIVLIGIFFAVLTSNWITGPIAKLLRATDAVSKGDLSIRTNINRYDEIGQLATSFDKMASSLENTTVSRDYMANIIDNLFNSLIVTDEFGQIETVNKATENLLGYSIERLKTMSILDICQYSVDLSGLLESCRDICVEMEYSSMHGSVPVLFSYSAMKETESSPKYIFVAQDITDLKEAQDEVLREKNLWDLVMNSVPSIFYMIDERGKFVKWNRLFQEVTEYSEQEFSKMRVVDVIIPEDRDLIASRINKAFESGIAFADAHILSKGGVKTAYYFTGTRIVLEENSYVVGMGFDVSQQKIAEEEKEKLRLELLQTSKLSAVGQLAGGAAHELNNPLGGILGTAQIILEEMPDDNQWYSDIKVIETAAKRCTAIISNLLGFARKKESAKQTEDINEMIEGTLAICQHQVELQKVNIIKELGSGLPKVNVEETQIKQVFLNIILNAQKAMPSGGYITIRTKQINDQIEISIEDTGVGIEKENQGKVFEPFFTTRGIGQGTGLGLSVSYGIIKNHDGDITVFSEGTGKGAVFRITLPIIL